MTDRFYALKHDGLVIYDRAYAHRLTQWFTGEEASRDAARWLGENQESWPPGEAWSFNVRCPECDAAIGESCTTNYRPVVWTHHKRQMASARRRRDG